MTPINYQQLTARLEEQGVAYSSMALANRVTLVATTLGGRIFVFLPDREDCLFWVNPAFAEPASFARFIRDNEWNIGGDRVWIGPEIQFIIQERGLEGGEPRASIPVAMDPGRFALEQISERSCRLTQSPALDAFCLSRGAVSLRLERTIRPVGDPLAGTGISDGIWFAGYEQETALRRVGGDPIPASWWSVTNLHAGGDVIIGTTAAPRYADFAAPAPPELHEIGRNYARARLTGERQYKTGYEARQVLGRFAYLHPTAADEGYLLVRAFYSNPAGRYLEEPMNAVGRNGYAVFVYNDDGRYGGFGEFECMGAAVGGPDDPVACLDRVPLYIYAGELAQLRSAAQALLGTAP